jgi:ABC-2 type transport system permease protein
MIDQLGSELLKIRTTRTLPVLLLVAVALTLLGTAVEGLSRTGDELAQEDAQRAVFNAAGSSVVFMATLAGLIAATAEFRYGTIRPTLMVEPRRRVVVAAKLAAASLAGIVFGVLCVGVCFGAGLAILAARDVNLALTGDHALALVLGPVGASVLGAMLGVAGGTLIRNQVGAIVALAAYAIAVDAVLFAALPSVGRFMPGKAGDALTGRPVEDLLAPGLGAAVLVAWTVTLVAAATVRNARSDI